MDLKFCTDAIRPMVDWLLEYKRTGERDGNRLSEILSLPDYQVEFSRYGEPDLPVCGISRDEAYDFFMNFDRKEFANERLAMEKESFLAFFNDIENRLDSISMFTSIDEDDRKLIQSLLADGLPDCCLSEIGELTIILIVSVGNSMGWPYGKFIDYDIANLDLFATKKDFLNVTAHEIHHQVLGPMLAPDGISPEDFFLQNFAFEGLAVHFNNNLATKGKPAKHDGPVVAMDMGDMAFYEANFDNIFDMIRNDYRAAKGMTLEDVQKMVGEHYERFVFMGRKVQQYPTYYFGCYMWGLVDMAFGKDRLFECIRKPELFVPTYNQVAEERYRL